MSYYHIIASPDFYICIYFCLGIIVAIGLRAVISKVIAVFHLIILTRWRGLTGSVVGDCKTKYMNDINKMNSCWHFLSTCYTTHHGRLFFLSFLKNQSFNDIGNVLYV